MLNLESGTELLRLLSDGTRLRLLLLLQADRFTVAELTAITGLSQSRVSTHLGKLRAAGLVQDRRSGNASWYTVDSEQIAPETQQLWGTLIDNLSDDCIQSDREQAAEIARQRERNRSWIESVAGSMDRHYSPGRTWEATARALISLLNLGDVLDIASGDGVLGELLAPRARQVTCIDNNTAVLAAGQKRLERFANVSLQQGDMHHLPFANHTFDQVFLMHALSYTERPGAVIAEAARVLRSGGELVLTTLTTHTHEATVAAFDHLNLGFEPAALAAWADEFRLDTQFSSVTSREARPPYFEVVTLLARAR
ncbi:MAG: ArsR family transcriptional regulator [Salinisphaeraceae bacterium]|nr:ArsR family transcriptional regulator [Salinisphaeraceae bacterium]